MATNLAPPSSQKAGARPISFLLDDQSTGVTPPPAFVDLVIRPEDLTVNDPSRINVQQTLGGAWGDNFGPGIQQITISGHTGWRRTANSSDDGEARFLKLKDQVFTQWHAKRAVAVAAGTDPNNVRLIFSDALEKTTSVVALMNFVLKRSKSRPLLCQYQIAMLVLESATPFGPSPLASPTSLLNAGPLQALGLTSLTASLGSITGAIGNITSALGNVQSLVNSALVAPVQAFMQQTSQLYGAVTSAISAGSGIAGQLISVAQMTTQAGVNIFRTVAAVADIPQIVKADCMAVASAYSNIGCVLNNALNQQIYYQNYSDVYGASNCSSTSGGRPISSLAGQNPFYSAVPTTDPLPVSITGLAQNAMQTLANVDPVLAPISTGNLAGLVSTATSGFSVSVPSLSLGGLFS